jgi:serine phosphatase RsbU (regulator of sigma subunit)
VGVLPKSEFATRHLETQPGDSLRGYSDGLTESVDAVTGRMFGLDRVEAIFRSCVDLGASTIVDRILKELDRFSPPELRDDDVSLSVLKIR